MARPGGEPGRQLEAIVPGGYLLLDDDRVTGETRARAVQLVEARGARVEAFLTAAELCPGARGGAAELCDLRDFLLGSREGGLVVELAGAPEGEAAPRRAGEVQRGAPGGRRAPTRSSRR